MYYIHCFQDRQDPIYRASFSPTRQVPYIGCNCIVGVGLSHCCLVLCNAGILAPRLFNLRMLSHTNKKVVTPLYACYSFMCKCNLEAKGRQFTIIMTSIPYKLLSHGLGYVVYIPTVYLNLELAAGQTIQLLVLFNDWLS